MQSEAGQAAIADVALGADCVAHARMFFNRSPFDLGSAVAPTFALMPEGNMVAALRQDYAAMSGMIFGEAPGFDVVMESIFSLQTQVNKLATEAQQLGQG